MDAAAKKVVLPIIASSTKDEDQSRLVVRSNASNELIIAVVGHVGSGTTRISGLLKEKLEAQTIVTSSGERKSFQVEPLKASDVIKKWAAKQNKQVPEYEKGDLQRASLFQDLGDAMREKDDAAVARGLIKAIHLSRNRQLGSNSKASELPLPDGQPRAYVLDSLRHPAEVHLLRSVYQTAFAAIGVVCDEERRFNRLFGDGGKKIAGKFKNVGSVDGQNFIDRDRKAKEKYGQRVDDAFHLADFFVDNSPEEYLDGKPNENWEVPEQIKRFLQIMTHSAVVRPRLAEVGMFAAHGAKLKSACLSRQVGAALLDQAGNLIATGTNEVPRAGGGVYGEIEPETSSIQAIDDRCAYKSNSRCSNTHEQREIEGEVVDALKRFFNDTIKEIQSKRTANNQSQKQEIDRLTQILESENQSLFDEFLKQYRGDLLESLHKTRLGGLIEFSRAVHAEMDALLSAARQRLSPVGARMFVTTFPCHSCARHLVAAGVDEVQYLEPYPKSKALALHDDAITTDKHDLKWVRPSQYAPEPGEPRKPKVLFRPFTGVAPRLYARAFLKDRDLKDDTTGAHVIKDPEWGLHWAIGRLSYVQLEKDLNAQDEGESS